MARQPISMSIEGLGAVSDVLSKVAPREAKNLMRSTLHSVAGLVRDDMRKAAPKDQGTLRKAIVSKRERQKGNVLASNVTITHGKGQKHDAYYWHMVNYGTVNSDAQPFIEPVVEAISPQIPAIFTREFSVKYEQLLQRKLKAAAKKK